jgi:hypothetical protein
MKSIIINRNRCIIKNNKRHCLYYACRSFYYFTRWQEMIYHYKNGSSAFKNKSHNYYLYKKKHKFNIFHFNGKNIT